MKAQLFPNHVPNVHLAQGFIRLTLQEYMSLHFSEELCHPFPHFQRHLE